MSVSSTLTRSFSSSSEWCAGAAEGVQFLRPFPSHAGAHDCRPEVCMTD